MDPLDTLNETLEEARLSCDSLNTMLTSSHPPLVLDLRSFLVYNQAHVKGSINVCIPKTLAKRQGFTVKSIESGICKKGDKDDFRLRAGAQVVLYDQAGAEYRDPASLLAKCFESLIREGACQRVFWLDGNKTQFPSINK